MESYKCSTIVIYVSRVLNNQFTSKYDPRVIIYARRGFIRLAKGPAIRPQSLVVVKARSNPAIRKLAKQGRKEPKAPTCVTICGGALFREVHMEQMYICFVKNVKFIFKRSNTITAATSVTRFSEI